MSTWRFNKRMGAIVSDSPEDGLEDVKRADYDWMEQGNERNEPMSKEEVDAYYERVRYGGWLVAESISKSEIGEAIVRAHNEGRLV